MQKQKKTQRKTTRPNRGRAGIGKSGITQPAGLGKLPNGSGINPHFLAGSFAVAIKEELPRLYVDTQLFSGRMLCTEADQLQFIAEIYPVLKKEGLVLNASYNEQTHPSYIVHDMLAFLENVDLNSLQVDQKADGYHLHVTELYGDESPCFFPLNFLPKICHVRQELYELFVCCLRLIKGWNNIPMLGEFIYGNYMEYFLQKVDDEDENEVFNEAEKSTVSMYQKNGIVVQYQKQLVSGGASLRKYKEGLDRFCPKDDVDHAALDLLKTAHEMALTKVKLHDVCDSPNGEVSPAEGKRIIWSMDDNDPIFSVFCEIIDADADGIGIVPYTLRKKYSRKGIERNPRQEAFCDLMNDFFTKGNNFYHLVMDKHGKECDQFPPKLNNSIKCNTSQRLLSNPAFN